MRGMKTRKRAAPVFKPYVMNQIALMPPSYIKKSSRRIIWCGEQSDRRPEPGCAVGSICRRKEIRLSSDDEAEYPDPRILQEGL